MFAKNSTTIFCSMVLVAKAVLLSSCLSLDPEPYSDYVGPETEGDLPKNQQKLPVHKPIDANTATMTKGPLEIGIQEAILLAMENNRSLVVERMNPEISRTFEREELAIFDPILDAEVSTRRFVADRLSRAGSGIESSTVDSATG